MLGIVSRMAGEAMARAKDRELMRMMRRFNQRPGAKRRLLSKVHYSPRWSDIRWRPRYVR